MDIDSVNVCCREDDIDSVVAQSLFEIIGSR